MANGVLHHAGDAGVDASAPFTVVDERRRWPRVQRRVAVIGDRDFVQRVHGAASDRGHRVVISSQGDQTELAALDGPLPDYDLLVVQAERVSRLADIPARQRQCPAVIALSADEAGNPQARPFGSPLPAHARVFKRSLDLAIAGIALVLTSPVMLAAALLIRLDSRGGAIFRQTRVGADGRLFTCYKLRTMVAGNDNSEHTEYVTAVIDGHATAPYGMYKLIGDPRVTRVGRHLRRLSIDELPQLWNVIRGDMSLVGPRPSLPHEVERYNGIALQRLRVKPGLTGLWQVSGRCQLTFAEMVALDNEYWREWSPMLELRIILRTAAAILRARGAA